MIQDELSKYSYIKDFQERSIALIIILIVAIAAVCYFRNSFFKRKEKYMMLSKLSEQTFHLASSPELKQHLSVVILEYKKGMDDYMHQLQNCGGKPEDYQNFNRQMDEANDFIDRLKKWMDEQPFQPVLNVRFDAAETIGVIVRMLKIVFHSKQITVQNQISDHLMVSGSLIYFGIAFEIMLFRLMQGSKQNAAIVFSAHTNNDFVTFTLASSSYVISEELRTILRRLIQKLQTNPKANFSLQMRAEICLKCVYENNGKFWFESNPEKGTVMNFTIPRGGLEKGCNSKCLMCLF